MFKRMIVPALAGVIGVAILLSLGFWQMSRLEQKLAMIAAIEARISAEPRPIDALISEGALSPEAARYQPATARGTYTGEAVHVLSSIANVGTGTRVISLMETEGGNRILVDRGFLPDHLRPAEDQRAEAVEIIGTLDWPRDADSFTPAPDAGRRLWFSREVGPIAEALNAQPVMIVAASEQGAPLAGLSPMPVGIDIRNDHLEYAITWFSLALVWAAMSLYLLWRIGRDPA